MRNLRQLLQLATIDPAAPRLAEAYGLGLELDQFCTALNMDDPDLFAPPDREIRALNAPARVFHAPFSELFPCAIDPKVRAVARERLEQSYALARDYGINRMVAHGNFLPHVYFPQWYVEQSVAFWKEFVADKPADFRVFVENVLDPEPAYLRDIVAGVDDPRCRLCLDVGHANIAGVSSVPISRWIEVFAPYLGHLHLHNNDGSWDWHRPLNEGSIPMTEVLAQLDELAPEASLTLEHPEESEKSLLWLAEQGRI